MIKTHIYIYRWGYAILVSVGIVWLLFYLLIGPSQLQLQRLKKTLSSQRTLFTKNQHAIVMNNKQEQSMLTSLQQLALKNSVMLGVEADGNHSVTKRWRLRGRGSIVGWFALQNSIQSSWHVMIELQRLSIIADQLLLVDAVMVLSPKKIKKESRLSQAVQQSFCVAVPGGTAFPAAMLAQLTSFNALRLVGIMSLAKQSRAYFQLSTGKILSVRVGDMLGLENYRVMAITHQQVTMQALGGQRLQLGLMR